MALQFHHTLTRLKIWSAAADGFSFVISHETRAGTGFHGRPGFMATWRPLICWQIQPPLTVSSSLRFNSRFRLVLFSCFV